MAVKTIAIVGGRGYTGSELLSLVARHPQMELAFASSSSKAGSAIRSICPEWPDPDAQFVSVDFDSVGAYQADAWVLAVPNGVASQWANAVSIAHPESVILDLSADHRFSNAWVYGLPERYREEIAGAHHIANPGCYATAIQLALLPLLNRLTGQSVAFGVSGYSGAGRTPSPKNDLEHLADNLIPYSLTGHVHEREASHQLGRDIRFLPHVASFFRGISMTISATLAESITAQEFLALFTGYYEQEPRVQVQEEIPEVVQVRNTPDAMIGGFAIDERDPRQISLVSVLDNLSKGAASQAVQNLNLAMGLGERTGLES